MKRLLCAVCFTFFVGAGCTNIPSSVTPATQRTNDAADRPATTSTTPADAAMTSMTKTHVTLKNGRSLSLTLPSNFALGVVAQGFKHLRFMSKSPDGRLFVGEMAELGDSSNGRLLVFDGPDPQTGVFSKVTTYLSGVRNPNSLTFYTDKDGKTWLYLALTDRLERFAYAAGDLKPSSAPQVIATFPAYGESFTVGGWHLTRTVITHNDKLYVSVGSSCNSCEEKADEPQRATILEMEPDGSGQHIVANGLRNAVGIGFEGDDLYATANEVDHLGPDKPQDLLYKITPGTNYGWPYCYQSNGKIYLDTTKTWKTPYDCSKVPLAEFAFDPHTAPLGFDTFDGSFLVALHGSGNKGIGNGYDVVSVTKNASGTYTGKTFLTGFLDHGTVTGRIVDVLKNDASSIYLTDDFNGAIYLLKKK